jgi:hypothetical protein
VGVNLLRRIEARAAGGSLRGARVGLHPELADAIQNFRRHEIAALEREFDMRIEIIAMTSLHRSDEKVEWIQRDGDEARPRLAAAATAADAAEAPPEPPAEQEPARTAEKRRRRRRGGRRHRKSATTLPSAEGAAEITAAPDAGPPTGVAEGTKAKKRRRRRRRGGKVATGAATQGG